jgi:FkbM family methyltransferase
MLHSLRTLYQAPYNKEHYLKAFYRWVLWKFIRLLKIKNYRFRLWNDRQILINHDSFHSMWIMYNYIVDWEEFNLIARVIRPEDHVCDIGANMGYYTIWMSKFINAPLHIHSFEPDTINYERLIKNLRINNLETNISVNKVAVTDVSGVIRFTTGLDGENHISINDQGMALQVDAVSLDDYAKRHNIESFAYVKIDVEGFELLVLKGALNLLSEKKIGIIQLEVNNTLQHSEISVETLLTHLKNFSYQLCRFSLEENKLTPIAYTPDRENYFAVADVGVANQLISKYK